LAKRKRFNPRRSKPEGERFAAVGMSERRFIPERYQFVPQLQPAAQVRWRVGRAAGPAHACERSSHTEIRRVLPDLEERHSGTFREGKLEIAGLRKTDEHFTD
jgi:hypothetical protein